MKISVIITTILVAQVSASFFDVFHGAVLSVQNSFGKLLSDVVTDVKETVDCTILAVEHVLSLSHDATTRYYDKCSSGTNKTESVTEAPQDAIVPKMEVTFNLPNNNDEYLQKVIPSEIDARINEKLSKVLGNYKPHDNMLSIQNVLAKESEQLAVVSVLVKKELEKLTNEVGNEVTNLKNIDKQRDSQPSVDTILQEIKVLVQRERNTENISEANEIHQVIDQVLGKLNTIESTEASENLKLEEILKDLETNSNDSFVGLRHQFDEWKEEEARHLSEIKSKIEEHEETSDYDHGSYTRNGSHLLQHVLLNTNINRDDIEAFSSSSETSSKNITLVIEVLDSSTSSGTYTDNDMSIIPVSNKTPFPQNKTLVDSGLNDIVITNNSYSTTQSPLGTEIIHTFESPAAVKSSERSTLSTNESATTPINFTESSPVDGNVEPVASIIDSDKKQNYTRNKTTSILSTNENNSTQSVIPTQTETSMIEVISSSQNNYNSNAVANSSTVNPLVENTSQNATGSVSDTIEENTKVSSYEESTAAVTEFITPSKKEHDSYTAVTSAPTQNKSTFEIETIEDIEMTTVFSSEEEFLDTTATESPNSENGDDYTRATIVKSTAQPISERTSEDNFAESENDETLTSITNSSIDSPAMLADTDSYTDITTSTILNIDLESTTIENEEPVILPKTNATILDEVTNEKTEINDTLSSFTENADSPVITETFKTVVTTTASGEQDLSSTSTQSAINEIVTASTAFPSIESISERIISSRNEVDLRNSPSLETNTFSGNPNIPDLNYMMKDTPVIITESPPVNREWLAANKLNQQIYNTNAEPRNNYDLKAPISLRNPSLQTIKPLINPEVLNRMPMYDQPAMPPIPRGFFNEAQKQADAIFDSIDKRLSQSDSPFGPDDDISLTSLLANAPRKPIVPRTRYFENPSFLPPLQPIRTLSFDNSVPGNAYRPQGLTTHRPRNLNNYKNPSIDYDSFFHTPPRNSEAHQRALKEARRIIANSKRSDRFINEIMNNKNKFNARDIFNE